VLRCILFDKIENNILLNLPKDIDLSLGFDEHNKAKRYFANKITLIKAKRKLLNILPIKKQ
jgi:hypothetical protein